jgi:hypothetical protein
VPSFFLIMDDVSRGLGWIAKRFIGKKEEEEEPLDNDALTKAVGKAGRNIDALDERLATLEEKISSATAKSGQGKVIKLPPLAAE